MIKLKDILNEQQWTGNIDTKYSPPEGTFKKSAEEIAKIIKKDAVDYKQAISRINFYYSRSEGFEDNVKKNAVLKALETLYKKELE
jgi:hypothetical protein